MPFEFGTNGAGTIANPRGFGPQFGIVDHFFDIAKPVRPVEIVATRQRGKLAVSTLVDSRSAGTVLPVGRAAAPIACLSALSAALLAGLSLAISSALATGLLRPVRLLALRLLTRLLSCAGLALTVLRFLTLILAGLLAAAPATTGRLALPVSARSLTLTGLLASLLFAARLSLARLRAFLLRLLTLTLTALSAAAPLTLARLALAILFRSRGILGPFFISIGAALTGALARLLLLPVGRLFRTSFTRRPVARLARWPLAARVARSPAVG
jgi:hypothetical protein